MAMAKRVFLFIVTNLLVVLTLTLVTNIIMSFMGVRLAGSQMTTLILFSAVWGMGGAFISLMMSKMMAKWMMGVKIIDANTSHPDMREIVQMVHRISQQAGLPKVPEVGIYESPEINAFATGPSKSNSLVAVSTGLLTKMNRDEIEGVIGHEIAHIANGDMVTMTLIQGIVNAFVLFLSRIISNILASQVEERNRHTVQFMLTILFDIVFTILGSIVVNYFSRQREYRADAGGAGLTSRHKMIAGLRRLQAVYESPSNVGPEDASTALDTLKISAHPRGGIRALFMTHPPLSERIARLEGRAL